MTTRHDESYYRSLLEAAQQGVENSKAFFEAIGNSNEALNDAPIQRTVESAAAHLEKLREETDQLWDQFKRVLGGG